MAQGTPETTKEENAAATARKWTLACHISMLNPPPRHNVAFLMTNGSLNCKSDDSRVCLYKQVCKRCVAVKGPLQ